MQHSKDEGGDRKKQLGQQLLQMMMENVNQNHLPSDTQVKQMMQIMQQEFASQIEKQQNQQSDSFQQSDSAAYPNRSPPSHSYTPTNTTDYNHERTVYQQSSQGMQIPTLGASQAQRSPLLQNPVPQNKPSVQTGQNQQSLPTGQNQSYLATVQDQQQLATGQNQSYLETGSNQQSLPSGQTQSYSTTGQTLQSMASGQNESYSTTGQTLQSMASGQNQSYSTTGPTLQSMASGQNQSYSTTGPTLQSMASGQKRPLLPNVQTQPLLPNPEQSDKAGIQNLLTSLEEKLRSGTTTPQAAAQIRALHGKISRLVALQTSAQSYSGGGGGGGGQTIGASLLEASMPSFSSMANRQSLLQSGFNTQVSRFREPMQSPIGIIDKLHDYGYSLNLQSTRQTAGNPWYAGNSSRMAQMNYPESRKKRYSQICKQSIYFC
ncbi:uncharacterized protein LOC100378485 [Saccoglossus kowalevskii]